jgi:hypothetical protein
MATSGTMSSPPSGLPVSSSHTTTAITATVNPMRRPSITQILRRDELRRERNGPRSGQGHAEPSEHRQVAVKRDPLEATDAKRGGRVIVL